MARPKKPNTNLDQNQEGATIEPQSETVTISEACDRLGTPEQFLRLALQPLHPDDFDSLKEIGLEEFASIAESLQRKALASASEPTVEQVQGVEEPKGEGAIATTTPTTPTQQQQKIDIAVGNALTQFVGEYVITLDQITSALAFASSKASLNNFVEIHSGVFRSGLEDYLEEFAEEMTAAAHAISQVSAKDFLSNHGITPKERRASSAINEILNLAK